MKSSILTALIMASVLGISSGRGLGQETPVNPGQAVEGRPAIQFEAPSYSFGRLESGRVITNFFRFTNTGDKVLKLTDIRSSCGCAAAENWTREVPPGGTGSVPVLFNSAGMAGPTTKHLWVTSNDPENPEVILAVQGIVYKVIDAVPQMALFNNGPDYQTNATRVIRLISYLPEPVTLSAPTVSNSSFRAELKTVKEGKEFELAITSVPPLPEGSLSVPITMTSSSPKMPIVTVDAFSVVTPSVMVMPPTVILPPGALEEDSTFAVTVKGQGTNQLEVTSPESSERGVEVSVTALKAGREYLLKAVFPKGFQIGKAQQVVLRARTNRAGLPLITIPVTQLEAETVSEAASQERAL